jgi:predicted Zn-dependent protease
MVNFVKDDNELALVIAHEMAHNTMKHIDARQQNAAIGVLADLAVVLLSRGQVNNTGFGRIGAGAFSQEFEAEADYVGLYIMANAGLPIADAPKFWRRMAAANPANIKTNHSASHPSTSYRMVALEETVKEINAKIEKGEALVPNMKDGKFKAPTK